MHVPTLALGLVTLVVMLAGSLVAPRAPMALIGMVGAAAAVALLDLREQGITVIGTIPAGLPVPSLPHVSLDGVLSLVPAALGVAFVAYTDNILTGRAFANRRNERIDAKRELLALGAANLASGRDARLPGQQQRQPHGDRTRGRWTNPAHQPGHRGHHRRWPSSLFVRCSPPFPTPHSARSSCTPRCG